MHSLARTPFSRTPAELEVQFQLPDGAGSNISAGGVEYRADASGQVTVPASVATELAAHFPPALPAITTMSAEELRAEIRALDARAADVAAQQLQPLQDALRRASEQASGTASVLADAAQQIAGFEANRRKSLGDMLLGLVTRKDVDAIERDRTAAAARVSAAEKD